MPFGVNLIALKHVHYSATYALWVLEMDALCFFVSVVGHNVF